MGFGSFPGDFRASSDRRLRREFLLSLDTKPFLNQCYKTKSSDALDLCKKLSKMGISSDMSIWNEPEPFRVDPRDSGSRNLHGFDQNRYSLSFHSFFNCSSPHRGFLQNSINGASPAELRLLELQDSPTPNGFREIFSLNSHRDFPFEYMGLFRPMKRSCDFPVILQNYSLMSSLMFEGNTVFPALAAMEGGSGELRGSSYPEDNLFIQSSSWKMKLYLKEDESISDEPLNLAAMISIYGSVGFMAKDQLGCRFLQKLVDEGTFLNEKVIFCEILGHVIELSTDPLGNSFIPKLLDVCTKEMVLKPLDLSRFSLNTHGTRVVQTFKMAKSSLQPVFLTLVKDLNGNHATLHSLEPNEHKTLLEEWNISMQDILQKCEDVINISAFGVINFDAMERPTAILATVCRTRVVQTFKKTQHREMAKSGLQPVFLTLVGDLNGNHATLRSLEPNEHKFVLEAATKHYGETATHRHGWCELQCSISSSVAVKHERLVAEIARNSLHLTQDPFSLTCSGIQPTNSFAALESAGSEPDEEEIVRKAEGKEAKKLGGFGDIYESFDSKKPKWKIPLKKMDRENGLVAVLDVENFRYDIPDWYDVTDFRKHLEEMVKQKFGKKYYIREMIVVGNLNGFYGSRQLVRFKQDSWPGSSYTLDLKRRVTYATESAFEMQVVFAGLSDVADGILQDFVIERYLLSGRQAFLFGTGDGDFLELVKFLEEKKCKVFLARPINCNGSLSKAFQNKFNLKDVFRGKRVP